MAKVLRTKEAKNLVQPEATDAHVTLTEATKGITYAKFSEVIKESGVFILSTCIFGIVCMLIALATTAVVSMF